jgi:Meiotically up-regulated gene 113
VNFTCPAQTGKTVVEEGKDDALIRSEAETGLWQRWKQTFELADSGGSHVFEIFASPSSKGCIYIIQQGDSDLYKIGWTADTEPSRRVAALQTASPENLSVVGSFSASSRQTEATLHRLFSQFKQRGEWFRLNVEQVSHMLDERWRSNQQIF